MCGTSGKIDVNGTDAVTFLERIYTHNVGRMNVGRCAMSMNVTYSRSVSRIADAVVIAARGGSEDVCVV